MAYVYGFDDMGRPAEMSYGTLDYVKGVQYNAAGHQSIERYRQWIDGGREGRFDP